MKKILHDKLNWYQAQFPCVRLRDHHLHDPHHHVIVHDHHGRGDHGPQPQMYIFYSFVSPSFLTSRTTLVNTSCS